jgi:uncharacterized membrane protein
MGDEPARDDEMVKLLSRISEHTRVTRQYVGILVLVTLLAIVIGFVIGFQEGSQSSGFDLG